MPGAGLVKALRFLRLLVAHLLSKRPPEDPAARCDTLQLYRNRWETPRMLHRAQICSWKQQRFWLLQQTASRTACQPAIPAARVPRRTLFWTPYLLAKTPEPCTCAAQGTARGRRRRAAHARQCVGAPGRRGRAPAGPGARAHQLGAVARAGRAPLRQRQRGGAGGGLGCGR